ncbi:MAG TPA: BON domain-containing protein [Caulifigura sp.]|jgi:osmotically-inducible protein OsmY|nr:BON domain-containing protein [Caulifigura sp.]
MQTSASTQSDRPTDVVGQPTPDPCAENRDSDPLALASSIKSAIDQVGRFAFRRIDVTAVNGKVVLRGFVKTWFQKQLAQHVALQVPGVNRLDNSLIVDPDKTGPS